jgi:CheY-like chemotaxis protein/HPt (histidine-containing phosphotransfer) domain-containing protein
MRSMLKRLLARLEGRPDSEHRQAVARLAVTLSLLFCAFAAASLASPSESPWSMALPVLVAEVFAGLAIIAHLLWRPGVSLARRGLGMVADFAALGTLLSLGAGTAPLYVLSLCLALDNGLRYGRRFLLAASCLATGSFLAAILASDYWLSNGPLSWALLGGLLLVPACITGLPGAVSGASNAPIRVRPVASAEIGQGLRQPLDTIPGSSEQFSPSGLPGGSMASERAADNGAQVRMDPDVDQVPSTSSTTRGAVTGSGDNVIAFADPFLRHRARVRSLEILIADDQSSSLSMLRRLLEKAGHRICSAGSGEEVLTSLVERRFDAAIIDLDMPGICGIETIQQARIMQSGGHRTPFIVLSPDSTADAVHDAQRAGAHVFLNKPIVVPQLLEAISSVASSTPLAKYAVGRSGGDAFVDAQISRQIIDEFRELLLGESFIRAFIDECLDDSERCIRELEKCGRSSEWTLFRDHCQALKGVAGNMGAVRLAQSASAWMICANSELSRNWKSSIGELGKDLEYARGALRTVLEVGKCEVEPGNP